MDADIPLSVVGSAVYSDLALMNHSCAANTTRFYQDGRAVLVAKRDIKAGEEVSLTYGIHHHNMGRSERLSSLKSSYKFVCACQACQNDYPTLGNLTRILEGKSLAKK